MIVTIDGPAGSGKSTIAQEVARCLGITYLDTGAMYRAVTLLALERGCSLQDEDEVGEVALEMDLRFEAAEDSPSRVFVGARDITEAIRTPSVSQKVSLVAAHPTVRHVLTARQRALAEQGDMVLEGRDTGTVVCPRADLKVFLTASPMERARRRKMQLEAQGVEVSLRTLERELLLRDTHDSSRATAPLRKAKDALEVDTTSLTIAEVVERICTRARALGVSGTEGAGPC